MTLRVSVVVPTYIRPDLLERCLGALVNQEFDPEGYEVIVADDAVSEETRKIVDSWGKWGKPAVRYVPVTGRHGPAAARNAGWAAARGEIVAFTDDDCIPAATWLKAGTGAFVDGIVGAWGKVSVPLSNVATDYQRNAALLEEGEFVTANCFYRRTALAAASGFDERFEKAWREDSDLYFTILEANSRLVRVPDALVVHPVRAAPWGVSLKLQRNNVFNALLYKKHPKLYRQRVQKMPPLRYYFIVGAMLAALGNAAAGNWLLAELFASIWILTTGQFCLQRLHRTARTAGHVFEMILTSILIPPLAIFWRIRGAFKYRVIFF